MRVILCVGYIETLTRLLCRDATEALARAVRLENAFVKSGHRLQYEPVP